MGVQYFVCTYASFILGELPMSRMTGSYGRSINIFKSSFRSMKNCKDGSDSCCIPYTPISQLPTSYIRMVYLPSSYNPLRKCSQNT